MRDWTDLRILAAIVRDGSLAAAGRRLGVHHVTIGRRLTALERELGVRLVDRLPRQAMPTEAATTIVGLIADIEQIVDRIDRIGRADRATVAGTVSVSAPPLVATELIAPSLSRLLASYPDLRIVIQSNPVVASLTKGEADIAVRMVEPDQLGMIVRRVAEVEMGLFAAPEIAAQPADRWRFIGHDQALAHLTHDRWLQTYAGDRPIVLRTSDIYVQRAAARAGVGIALLPTAMTVNSTDLRRVDPAARPPVRAAWLVVHPDLRRSPAVRAVLDHLVATLTSHEGGVMQRALDSSYFGTIESRP